MPKCRHPNCDRKVDAKSLTKCCRHHGHSAYCQCAACTERAARAKRRAARKGVTTIHVPRPGCYHGDVIYDAVTVSQPPWERNTA